MRLIGSLGRNASRDFCRVTATTSLAITRQTLGLKTAFLVLLAAVVAGCTAPRDAQTQDTVPPPVTSSAVPAPVSVSLEIAAPADGEVFETPNILLQGTTDNFASVEVNVDGHVYTPRVNPDGSFQLPLALIEGENIIEVSAVGDGAEPAHSLLRVLFAPPPPDLSYGFTAVEGGAAVVDAQVEDVLLAWVTAQAWLPLRGDSTPMPSSGPWAGPAAAYVHTRNLVARAITECQPEYVDCSYINEINPFSAFRVSDMIIEPLLPAVQVGDLYQVGGVVKPFGLRLTNLKFGVRDGQAVLVAADVYTTAQTDSTGVLPDPSTLGNPVPMDTLAGQGGMTADGLTINQVYWAATPIFHRHSGALDVIVAGVVDSATRKIQLYDVPEGIDGVPRFSDDVPKSVRNVVFQLGKVAPMPRRYGPGIPANNPIAMFYRVTGDALGYSARVTLDGTEFQLGPFR